MSSPESSPEPLARMPPVKGWKVAAVLIALIVGTCAVCVGATVGYPYYMSLRG